VAVVAVVTKAGTAAHRRRIQEGGERGRTRAPTHPVSSFLSLSLNGTETIRYISLFLISIERPLVPLCVFFKC